MNKQADDRTELGHLTGALAAHLERRSRRGVTRISKEALAAPAEPSPVQAKASAAAAPEAKCKAPKTQEPSKAVAPAEVTPIPKDTAEPAAKEPQTAQEHPETSFALPVAKTGKSLDLPPTTREIAQACPDLKSLQEAVAACRACDLCQSRKQTVFQDGTGSSGVLFVGEAPGEREEATGVPFAGYSGDLLTDIINKGMHLKREEVAIVNVLKCRPPEDRDPSPLEMERCAPFLDRQIELLNPQIIIPLGRHASNHIMGTQLSMGRMRGRAHDIGGRKVVPTYHPAYLLRSPSMKKECWKDIQIANRELAQGRPRP